ncbi:hypothetical protein PHISCL_01059 [Aspergillus sclerotialis]|uniref:Uncharacterized protein n=1 Tax=Aspergillus sclerotialis TaxID=2070753 RepID=A0A3A3A9H4_9EURO|nr:hypothetical protein PHISCL_01059 [Aspergillus sclerotialis]
MSSPTLPYLQRQLKPRLLEFAQQTNLQGYKTYNKSDLAAALDDHLRANQSRYSRNALFEEFYSRLARSGRAGSERTTTPSAASPRRSGRKVKAEEVDTQEETEVTTENESPVATPPQSRRTVARTALNEPDARARLCRPG